MRPTFMGFETATRGLMSNQKALDIVANNVTNIGVTGYTRQRVDLVSLNVNMRYTRYNQNSVSFGGQGTGVYGISQVRDSFLDKRFRQEYSDVGYYDTTSKILSDISDAMDEITPSNITIAMDDFYAAWNELLQKEGESTNSANILAKATQLVQVFRQMSSKLDNIWEQQQYNLSSDVENINKILANIAELNDTIRQEKFNCMDVGNNLYQPLELIDQRNVLLDSLSGYADITYVEDSDGMLTVKMGGHVAVQGNTCEKLVMSTDESDPEFKTVRLFWNDTGENVNFASGSVRASTDMLNGRGINAVKNGEVFNQGIHYYKEKINALAKTFADAYNSVIEMTDTNGDVYDPPRYKQLFRFETDYYSGAFTIMINEDWENNAAYICTNVADKLVGGDSDNSYAAKAVALFNSELDFGEFKGKITDYIKFYSVSKLGNDKDFADNRLESVSAIADNLLDQIQGISGVSIDEEGVQMMQWQKAYDAVSRVFTTLDEMLDKLINGTGVVGR